MIRVASFLLSLALGLSQTPPMADRTLAAEGDYVARTKIGDKTLSHWQLWYLSNGEYEVVDTSVKNASSIQIFRFDHKFFPIGYTKKLGQISQAQVPIQNFPKIPGETISCQYQSKELNCTAESSEGHKSSASIAAKPPYVFVGEFYDLDFVWFMTGVVSLASRNGAKEGVVNVYALTNGGVTDIGLKADNPMKIVFTGEETAHVFGKAEVLRKFEWGSRVLRVTTRGLVVSESSKSDPAVGFGMSGYKEYEPWGTIR